MRTRIGSVENPSIRARQRRVLKGRRVDPVGAARAVGGPSADVSEPAADPRLRSGRAGRGGHSARSFVVRRMPWSIAASGYAGGGRVAAIGQLAPIQRNRTKRPREDDDEELPRAKRHTEGARLEALEAAAGHTRAAASKLSADPTDEAPSGRQSYVFGEHGAASRQRVVLGTTGTRHESEHAIGFEALNRGSGLSRSDNPILENKAPAYLEVKDWHRAHVGTGTGQVRFGREESGFTDESYRDTQRALLNTNDPGAVSAALQLNQLAYTHDVPGFRGSGNADAEIADRSHKTMAENIRQVTYAASPGRTGTVPLGPRERAEIELSRWAARTGTWPTAEQQQEALRRHMELQHRPPGR